MRILILPLIFLIQFGGFSQKPPMQVLIRIFKYEKQLEIWTSNFPEDSLKLLKTYKICMMSGKVGPKRKEGDLQVPEGFYKITELNKKSKYHMSLGINYPNSSDRILGGDNNLGGSIYLHGECVSIGCIAFTNKDIEEIYQICNLTQDKEIQVHIFPIRFKNPKSLFFLTEVMDSNPSLIEFERNLMEGYYFFENKKRVPFVYIDNEGTYFFF